MDSDEQAEAFREGWIDLGILQSLPGDAERWLYAEKVYTDPLVAALPATHRLAARSDVRLKELANESFIFFPRRSDPALYDTVLARCRGAGFSPRVTQEAFGWQTITGLVGAGVGIAVAPRSLSRIKRPGVTYRRVKGLAVEMTIVAAWRKGDRSPVRERFVTALRAVATAGARRRPRG
jgi:DNA-binding transcriptional LysR family regulator